MLPLSSTTWKKPIPVKISNDITGDSNFPQGCAISPDGLCVLTSTASDNLLRLYNVETQQISSEAAHENTHLSECPTSSWNASLIAREGDSIRSYCWYPLMNSYQPLSCAFLATTR